MDCSWFILNDGSNEGGAIRLNGSAVSTVTNCGFVSNMANAGAACRGVETSRFNFENATFAYNAGSFPGAAYSAGPLATAEFKNCILWGGVPSELYVTIAPTITYSDIQGGFTGIGNVNADPNFATYMGLTYVLGSGSPCIDAGDPTMVDRIYDNHPLWPPSVPNGSRADMGAYGGPNNDCMYQ